MFNLINKIKLNKINKIKLNLFSSLNSSSSSYSYSSNLFNLKLFNSILISNRSEIALRIIKTAKKFGIKTISIYSDNDKQVK